MVVLRSELHVCLNPPPLSRAIRTFRGAITLTCLRQPLVFTFDMEESAGAGAGAGAGTKGAAGTDTSPRSSVLRARGLSMADSVGWNSLADLDEFELDGDIDSDMSGASAGVESRPWALGLARSRNRGPSHQRRRLGENDERERIARCAPRNASHSAPFPAHSPVVSVQTKRWT
jgi:hypothetical protein